MKIAILHDHFLYSGWWERLVTMLAKWIWADIYTGFFNKDSLDPRSLGFEWKFTPLSEPLMKQGLRHFKMMWLFNRKTKLLEDYDIVIFSGNCIEGVSSLKKPKKIYFCHTPPRYMFDKFKHHLKQKSWIKKLLFKLLIPILRSIYLKNLSRMDIIVSNSKCVQERLKGFTWFDSLICYPPVDTSNFIPWNSEGFYLSYARITDIKRVHLIAEAFTKMPDKNLVIIYNPSDPYLETVNKICLWHANISLVNTKWSQIPNWVARCRATIYIPQDEDFGMTPIESMSAWKPVIWVDEWWLKETIIHEKTWLLLKPDFDVNDICTAVRNLDQDKCDQMRNSCIERAKEFDLQIFIDWMKKIIFWTCCTIK